MIRRVWENGGRFDGWTEHFSYRALGRRGRRGAAAFGVDLDWYTTRERDEPRCCPGTTSTPGLDKDWLWQDWQDSLAEYEQDDCRWTPCFDCGVCPSMDTEIQIGPTGRKLLPLTPVGRPPRLRGGGRSGEAGGEPAQEPRSVRNRSRRAARRRWCSGPDPVRQARPAAVHLAPRLRPRVRAGVRRAGVPIAFSQGFTPHPKISYASAAPTGVASEAEYLEIGLRERVDPEAAGRAGRGALARPRRARRGRGAAAAAWPTGSTPRTGGSSCPGRRRPRWRRAVAAFLAADEVLVERMTKQGRRTFDARAAVMRSMWCGPAGDVPSEVAGAPCAILDLVVRQVTPSVRPDDVLPACAWWPTWSRRSRRG